MTPRTSSPARIYIGGSPDVMEEVLRPGDLVLVPNRYDLQLCAIECKAGCIVICNGKAAPRTIEALAKEKGCHIILTPHDTYGAARLVSQSGPGAPFHADRAFAQVQCGHRHRGCPPGHGQRSVTGIFSPSWTRTASTAAWSPAGTC